MKGGIILKVFVVLGIVLFAAMFPSIMTAVGNLRYGAVTLTNFIAFDTILSIAPTLLWLGGIAGFGFAEYASYRMAAAHDTAGFMRMITGVLEIVVFVTMFGTVLTNINTVYGSTNATNFIAFTTVVGIAPTLLFLGGIGSGLFSASKGGQTAFRRAKGGGSASAAI